MQSFAQLNKYEQPKSSLNRVARPSPQLHSALKTGDEPVSPCSVDPKVIWQPPLSLQKSQSARRGHQDRISGALLNHLRLKPSRISLQRDPHSDLIPLAKCWCAGDTMFVASHAAFQLFIRCAYIHHLPTFQPTVTAPMHLQIRLMALASALRSRVTARGPTAIFFTPRQGQYAGEENDLITLTKSDNA